jgi:hypothetical protein
MNGQLRLHSVSNLHTFALDKLHIRLPIKAIARAFNLEPTDIRYALQKGDTIPKGRGEHSAREDDTEKHPLE